jgi:hypothetical protein
MPAFKEGAEATGRLVEHYNETHLANAPERSRLRGYPSYTPIKFSLCASELTHCAYGIIRLSNDCPRGKKCPRINKMLLAYGTWSTRTPRDNGPRKKAPARSLAHMPSCFAQCRWGCGLWPSNSGHNADLRPP